MAKRLFQLGIDEIRSVVHTHHCVCTFKVSLMDPSVGAIFHSFDDRLGLVVAAHVLGVGVVVENTRPQDSASLFGNHCGIDARKIRATTFLDVVQVHVKSQDTNSTGAILLVGDVVVVGLDIEIGRRKVTRA